MYICILVVAGGWRILNKSTLWIYLVLTLLLSIIKALLSEVNLIPYIVTDRCIRNFDHCGADL